MSVSTQPDFGTNFAGIYPVSYGLLYNWYAVTDVRGITVEGWHVPTNAEFTALRSYIATDQSVNVVFTGGYLKETGTTYWNAPNTGATNTYGFNARAGSSRVYNGVFGGIIGTGCSFHASDWDNIGGAIRSGITIYYDANTSQFQYHITEAILNATGKSIRLVKDTTALAHGETGIYTGNDGKVYRTICIGTIEVLADNLCETLYRDGSPIPEVTDNAAWAALTSGALCAYNNDWNNV